MIYTIKNDDLSVSVKKIGAELCSIKTSNKEYLWQGDQKFWTGQSPLLFPLVGPMHSKTIGGLESEMGNHGFLKVSEFNLVEQKETSICLEYSSNEETRKLYPFEFRVEVKFEVIGKTLNSSYKVINKDNKTMVYSFGLHPAFFCKEEDGKVFEDYYIKFNDKKTLQRCKFMDNDGGVSMTEKLDFIKDSQKLNMQRKFFKRTIIFNNIDFDELKYGNDKDGDLLNFKFSGFNIFSMWQPENAPFLCLEPWYGYNGLNPKVEKVEENSTVKFLEKEKQDNYTMTIELC